VPFIDPSNTFALLSILFLVTVIGLVGEERKWFGNIAGTLFVIAFMALLANMGVVPGSADSSFSVPAYSVVFDYFVPLAIPLLLFGADLRSILETSRKLLFIFIIGSIGILLGAALSYFLFDVGENTFKVVGVFAATLIGGSVNFLATAETLEFTNDPLFATAAAVDNLFANGYIFLLFLFPGLKGLRKQFADPPISADSLDQEIDDINVNHASFATNLIQKLALSIAIAFFVCWLGQVLGSSLQTVLGLEINLDILVSTILILMMANFKFFRLNELEHVAFPIGMILLYVFLGVIGAAVSLKVVAEAGPSVIYICITTIVVHLLFTMGVAKLSNISLEEVVITSAANTAGPSISAPLAAAIGQKQLVSSAILLGVMGYALGTFLGVGLAKILQTFV